VVGLLLIANTINIGVDLGAMAAALKLLVPVPSPIYIAGFTIITAVLQIFVRYSRYVSILRWLTISLFAYVATEFVAGIHWMSMIEQIFWPKLHFNSGYLTVVVAIFGPQSAPTYFLASRRGG
jgi:Mn2+/Fe2+ NRAMP family transporter